jgi:hypothetical protein
MSGLFRLILTGSRNVDADTLWVPSTEGVPEFLMADADLVPRTVDELLNGAAQLVARAGYSGLLLAHGHCPRGVDALGDRWALRRKAAGWPVDVDRFPAAWSEGRGAGFARNRELVKPGAHLCYALIAECAKRGCTKARPHGSHGASDCARVAEGADIPVQRFEVYTPVLAAQVPLTLPDSKETNHA